MPYGEVNGDDSVEVTTGVNGAAFKDSIELRLDGSVAGFLVRPKTLPPDLHVGFGTKRWKTTDGRFPSIDDPYATHDVLLQLEERAIKDVERVLRHYGIALKR